LGKSTIVPTVMASTCGVKVLFLWIMRAWAEPAGSTGAPLSGSSHTTTPE
jgi:hypothetical protein